MAPYDLAYFHFIPIVKSWHFGGLTISTLTPYDFVPLTLKWKKDYWKSHEPSCASILVPYGFIFVLVD